MTNHLPPPPPPPPSGRFGSISSPSTAQPATLSTSTTNASVRTNGTTFSPARQYSSTQNQLHAGPPASFSAQQQRVQSQEQPKSAFPLPQQQDNNFRSSDIVNSSTQQHALHPPPPSPLRSNGSLHSSPPSAPSSALQNGYIQSTQQQMLPPPPPPQPTHHTGTSNNVPPHRYSTSAVGDSLQQSQLSNGFSSMTSLRNSLPPPPPRPSMPLPPNGNNRASSLSTPHFNQSQPLQQHHQPTSSQLSHSQSYSNTNNYSSATPQPLSTTPMKRSPYPPAYTFANGMQSQSTPTPATSSVTTNAANGGYGNSKIDAAKMPRPQLFTRPHVVDGATDGTSNEQQAKDQLLPIYYPNAALLQETTQSLLPPPADSRFYTIDDGNATPNFIRSSVYSIPRDRGIWHKTGDLVLGVVCTPLSQRTKSQSSSNMQMNYGNNNSIDDGNSIDFIGTPPLVGPLGQVINTQSTVSSNPTDNKEYNIALSSVASIELANSQFVPLIVTNDPPPRCSQCLAYMNPYWDKQNGRCNFCGKRQQILSSLPSTSSLFSYSYNGVDNNIPGLANLECQYGTVEYTVSGPYITRDTPVRGNTFVYAIDLTCIHLSSYLKVLHHATTKAQELYVKNHGLRVGIVFVSAVGIVVCRKNSSTDSSSTSDNHDSSIQQYTVMPDVSDDPFCSLPLQEWTYQLENETDLQGWSSLLTTQLPTDIPILQQQLAKGKNNASGDSNWELSPGGAALAFLVDALAEVGGRGIFISRRRPNHGVGNLPHRNEAVQPGRNVQQFQYKAYTPIQYQHVTVEKDVKASEFYKKLGTQSVKNRVALDIVIHTSSNDTAAFLDMATLSEVCRISCGKLTWLSVQQDWESTLREELLQTLTANAGWDTVFKLRCSEGLNVKTYLSGPGVVLESSALGGSPELEMTCVMPNTSVAVELEHRVGGISKSSKYAFLQSALLYTTIKGERRMRVSTLALRISAIPEDVYLSADFNTVAALYMRQTALSIYQLPTEVSDRTALRGKIRDSLYYKVLQVLTSYRENTQAKASPISQLLLPKRLQLLPLFCMSFMKSPMLQPGAPLRIMDSQISRMIPSGDERAYFNFYLGNYAEPRTAMMMVYPQIFSLTELPSYVGRYNESSSSIGYVNLPTPLSPNIVSLDDTGAYLIDGGIKCYLYVGRHASNEAKEILQKFDGNCQLLDRFLWQLRVWTAVTPYEAIWRRPNWLPLQIIRQPNSAQEQTTSHQTILSLLVADAVGGEKDYTDFLCTMHQRICDKLSATAK